MKYCIPGLLLCIIFSSAKAQRRIEYPLFVSISPDLIVPNSEFAKTHNTGFGATVLLGYKLNKSIAPVIAYSYYNVPGRNVSVNELRASLLTAGARLYLGNFYLLGNGGAIFTKGYDDATRFVFGVGGGDEIRLNRRSKLDISVSYESFNTSSNNGIFALRMGYTYFIGR